MEKESAVAALAALAQGSRLDVFRLLVQAGEDGMPAGQIAEHLGGVRSLPATIELVKLRTQQFAKRQMTWFRRQLPLTWMSLAPQSQVEEVVEAIAEKVVLPAKDAKGR